MGKEDDNTKILLDADVIRNFISGEKLGLLSKIFPERLCIIDRVKNELCRSNKLKLTVENFIRADNIQEIRFPDKDMEIVYEYAKLISESLGDGESACLAFARYRRTYISSSNLRDVLQYCKTNGIKNIPTMEVLREALEKKVMTEKEINEFIGKCLSKGEKLPAKSWIEYLELNKQ